jgi:hypothetical protein
VTRILEDLIKIKEDQMVENYENWRRDHNAMSMILDQESIIKALEEHIKNDPCVVHIPKGYNLKEHVVSGEVDFGESFAAKCRGTWLGQTTHIEAKPEPQYLNLDRSGAHAQVSTGQWRRRQMNMGMEPDYDRLNALFNERMFARWQDIGVPNMCYLGGPPDPLEEAEVAVFERDDFAISDRFM